MILIAKDSKENHPVSIAFVSLCAQAILIVNSRMDFLIVRSIFYYFKVINWLVNVLNVLHSQLGAIRVLRFVQRKENALSNVQT